MKPTGADAVKVALLDAATKLFSMHGPSAVSIRRIAATAGVNHGLVHRHFGSKEALLSAVLERSSRSIADRLGEPDAHETLGQLLPRVFAASRAEQTYWRILARAILEGLDPRQLQRAHPVVRRIIVAARNDGLGDDAELVTAIIVAAGLGLLLFEPFLRNATGVPPHQWATLPLIPSLLLAQRPRASKPSPR